MADTVMNSLIPVPTDNLASQKGPHKVVESSNDTAVRAKGRASNEDPIYQSLIVFRPEY